MVTKIIDHIATDVAKDVGADRDVYEVANQLGSYVGPNTEKGLASFLLREAKEAENLADKIEGLEADLDSAVEVAFKRGATDWVRLNYPSHYDRLTAAPATKLDTP